MSTIAYGLLLAQVAGSAIDYGELLRQLAIIISTLAGGGAGAYVLVKWLKEVLNLSGKLVMVLAGIVSLILAVAGMVAAGELGISPINEENLSEIVIAIFFASQVIYFTIRNQLGGDDDEEPEPPLELFG